MLPTSNKKERTGKLKKSRKIAQIIKIPVWALLLVIVNAVAVAGLVSYLYFNRQIASSASKTAPSEESRNPDALVREVSLSVIPPSGYKTRLTWGDIGRKLVAVGAIDPKKYAQMFQSNSTGAQEMVIFEEGKDKPIEMNENNSHFLVNTLWALGLTNKSQVLDEGPMKTGGNPADRFASTAGWTLGTKPAMELYSSEELVPLTDEQQEQVKQIAENVFSPCCGNSTAFPDCNHGIAALGYIELAVANGLSEEQIYKDLLAFNSFWFPTNYIELGVYFAQQGKQWESLDAKLALSAEYSSAQGAQKIHQAVANVPGLKSQGGSCGA